MKRKVTLTLLILLALSILTGSTLISTTMGNSKTKISYIPVDADPYYKSLDGEAAYNLIYADTQKAAEALTSSASSGGSAAGVGNVEWLYADGWQLFTLKALGANAEIWVANDLNYLPGDLRPTPVVTQEQIDYLLLEFNTNIYPQVTTYFGYTNDRDGTGGLFATQGYSWYQTTNPQRVMILVYNIIDENYLDPEYPFYVAGYFWPTMNDEYADRNIIHIDVHDWANRVGPDVSIPYMYEATITHEYEHAIHYDHDPDEKLWVDEGMADLSGYLAGYEHPTSHLAYYMVYHRTPLTSWGGGLEDYGESYLFQLYLMENFGGTEFIKALLNEPLNGIAGIENQLAAFGYDTSFNDLYRDWTVANYIDDTSLTGISDAQLGYDSFDIPSEDTWGYSIQWSIKNYYGSNNKGNLPIPRYWGGYKSGTVQWPIGDLSPYTPMYLTYKGFEPELISTFRGETTTGVAAHSGDYQLWGGRGNLLYNTATTTVSIPQGTNAEITFWTYYEIESFWDFGFVQISTDGGATWTSLGNDHTTSDHDPDAHPDVIANLPGFTGSSEAWVQETFDLSAYAGQTVDLRFLYVTDWATTETGFYIDDITVSDDTGTLLWDDLESGSGNWVLDGWEYTTGLATNDWELTYIDPIYNKGKFSEYKITDSNIFDDGGYQWDFTTLDTQALNRDMVTVILSNQLPEDIQSPAEYLLLVEKGNSKP